MNIRDEEHQAERSYLRVEMGFGDVGKESWLEEKVKSSVYMVWIGSDGESST